MTLKQAKMKVLQLIEEIDVNETGLTSDPDIKAKMNAVIQQIQSELARMKKIPSTAKEEVTADDFFDLNSLPDFYQLKMLRFQTSAGEKKSYSVFDTFVEFPEDGTATFIYYKYPEEITDETDDEAYEFELSQDALEVLPYGVAADLLKNDVSTDYGKVYAERYETMLQRLDSRYSVGTITIEGGFDF